MAWSTAIQDYAFPADGHLNKKTINLTDFEEGVSCPRCAPKLSQERKESLRERQRQMALAKKRNTQHLGKKMPLKTIKPTTSCTSQQDAL